MFDLDRRSFLRVATAASFGAASGSTPVLAVPQATGANTAAAAPAAPPAVTRMLARYIVSAKYEDLPQGSASRGRGHC